MAKPGRTRSVHQLSVGQVAQRSDVAVSALHFYESKGLIKCHRTNGNQRRYPRDVLRRVAVIKVAQRSGVPLQTVRQAFLALPCPAPIRALGWPALIGVGGVLSDGSRGAPDRLAVG